MEDESASSSPSVSAEVDEQVRTSGNFNQEVAEHQQPLISDEIDRERSSLLKQLSTWQSNRRYLEERVAFYGADVPVFLHNQFEEAKNQIVSLEARLAALRDDSQ